MYLFSDGYQDQFGGKRGKKFMIKRFKKLLLSIQGKDRQPFAFGLKIYTVLLKICFIISNDLHGLDHCI